MSWNNEDNKHYRGPIDRVFVSRTESYEVNYFIDDYLKSRGYAMTDESRKNIGSWMMMYAGRAPVTRDDLNAFIDKQLGR